MNNNDKHNHHHVSKFYLKHWGNKANKVWVYELNPSAENRLPNPGLLHVDKVCSDYHLYSIGNDNVSIENWADKNFETHCAKSFKKIISLDEIDEEDIVNIKAFLALTIARHPLLKESSDVIVNVFPHRNKILNPLAQTIPLRVSANLRELDQLDLQFSYVPNDIDASFITSDVPFIISWNSKKEEIFREKELNSVYRNLKAAEDTRTKQEIFGENQITRHIFERIWFPISPKTLGFLSKTKNLSPYEKITDVAHVQNINSGILSFAKDILIANDSNVFDSLPKFRKLTE